MAGAKGRFVELDGIRAVAIGAVLAFHCLNFPVTRHSLADYAARIPSGGWGGVDIFFALSGFLVGGILIDGRDQPGQIRRFLVRRVARIIPLYAVVLGSFYVAPALIESDAARAWLFSGAAPWWSYVTLTQNFATPIMGGGSVYMGPTWSLAVEVQIYLIFSLLLTRAPIRAILPMMIAGVVIAETCRLAALASGHGIFGYFVLPARIDGACLGVITSLVVRSDIALAAVRRRVTAVWAAVLGLFAGAAILSLFNQGGGSAGANIYTHLALALASSAMIAALRASPHAAINRALRSPPLIKLGVISYGIYLLHIPVIGLTHVIMGRANFMIDGWRAATATLTGVVATVGLAKLSWHYFEKPIIGWAHRISQTTPAHSGLPRPGGDDGDPRASH